MGTIPLTEPAGPHAALAANDPRRVRRAVLAATGDARNDASATLTDAVTLMAAAVGAALEPLPGAGAAAIRNSTTLVCATVGSDDSPDPAGAVASLLDLVGATTMVASIGVPQQRLVSNALLAVETGAADAVLVLGGEAKASSLAARRNDLEAPPVPCGTGPDHPLVPVGELMAEPEIAAALWDPYAQYALIDSALALREGSSPRQLLAEVSELWRRFDRVASTNPRAAFTGPPHTAEDLATTTSANRLLAFPYNKWHSTQWALDHASALVICSEELALGAGIPAEELLHPQVALDSSFGTSLSRRAEPHRWPAMGVLGEAASTHLDTSLDEIATCEVYSCFPAAVRVQQRELGLDLAGTPTLTGGMPFAGGPFNHFTYMATDAVRQRMLGHSGVGPSGDLGLVTTVSGLLTKPGLMVWGREPHRDGALVADLAGAARAGTAEVAVAPFEPERGIEPGDTVLAATVTGGFDPKLFSLVDDREGIRHVVSAGAPEGDPADALGEVLADTAPHSENTRRNHLPQRDRW